MKTFKHKSGKTATIMDSVWYLTNEGHVIPAWIIEDSKGDWQEVTKDYEILALSPTKKGEFNIESVRRLSDGEVFSVGDDVKDKRWLGVRGKILRIEEKNGSLKIHFWKSFSHLHEIQKSRQPILTTEDGVELFEGDSAWLVGRVHMNYIGEAIIEDVDVISTALFFSTREAAEEYRLNNARVLSIEDIRDNFNNSCMISSLEELAKSRL